MQILTVGAVLVEISEMSAIVDLGFHIIRQFLLIVFCSAVRHRYLSQQSGLFREDACEATGNQCSTAPVHSVFSETFSRFALYVLSCYFCIITIIIALIQLTWEIF